MRGMPPLQGRRQRRLLQADPQTRVREPPPDMPTMRPLCPLCPPGPAQRRHIRPGAKWTPGGLNPDDPQPFGKTRKKKIPMWAKWQFPRGHPVFFLLAASFRCSAPVFYPGSPSKIVSTPYIYRDELPISITYILLSTFDSSSFMVVSSLSSP